MASLRSTTCQDLTGKSPRGRPDKSPGPVPMRRNGLLLAWTASAGNGARLGFKSPPPIQLRFSALHNKRSHDVRQPSKGGHHDGKVRPDAEAGRAGSDTDVAGP